MVKIKKEEARASPENCYDPFIVSKTFLDSPFVAGIFNPS
ncbi:hypothetical protein ASZ90_017816 [hydrocarbon metagenome]|uniref:Uncharacterized protein n=1 Tax=hydrocarbon metagenome TaxID=938273 RepID=A0A0W8E7R6_9ZZZZ